MRQKENDDFFTYTNKENCGIALATVSFYNKTERKPASPAGRKWGFITVISIDKWYKQQNLK